MKGQEICGLTGSSFSHCQVGVAVKEALGVRTEKGKVLGSGNRTERVIFQGEDHVISYR